MGNSEKIVKPSTLGIQLKRFRLICLLTLRQVEDITGISNSYLSQLETGKIKRPSVNAIYKLSELYNVDINKLLHLAGFVTEIQHKKWQLFTSEISSMNITKEEEEKLINYLQFLRSLSNQNK